MKWSCWFSIENRRSPTGSSDSPRTVLEIQTKDTELVIGRYAQMVCAEVAHGPDDSAVAQSFSYAYDALGRRVSKMDAFGATHFAWDGDRMALEQRGESETTHLYHSESFVPLAQIENGSLHHLHTDHLGTPLEASNDAGEITWRGAYRTWGNVFVEECVEIQQRLRFQGQYFDVEAGIHYNRSRYYEPNSGRFISLRSHWTRWRVRALRWMEIVSSARFVWSSRDQAM